MPKICTGLPFPALAGAAMLAACASPVAPAASGAGEPATAAAPANSQRCFRPDQVNGWRAGEKDTVYVRTGVRRVFRMQLLGPCPDVNWSERIGIEATGSPWICSGLDATVISPSPIGPRRCPVKVITELTPEEAASLPARYRP